VRQQPRFPAELLALPLVFVCIAEQATVRNFLLNVYSKEANDATCIIHNGAVHAVTDCYALPAGTSSLKTCCCRLTAHSR
jgi:hypothetical protein